MLPRLPLAAALALLGCNDHEIARLTHEDVFLQQGTTEADILFVIDNSISMADEQILVGAGFDGFIQTVGDADIDFHIGIVTTDMDVSNSRRARLVEDAYLSAEDDYVALFNERVQVGTDGSDKERGLQAAYEALVNEQEGIPTGFLRSSAALAMVFVSDENDCSDDNYIHDPADGSLCYEYEDELVPTADYIRRYQDIKGGIGGVMASSIVGPDAEQGCEGSWPGKRYRTVSEKLGGLVGDICESDFSQIMDDIGQRITDPNTVFPLSYAAVSSTIEVAVDDEIVLENPDSGWVYDAPTYSILFPGSYVPPFGSSIRITYEVAGAAVSADTGS